MPSQRTPLLTLDQYLEQEREADLCSEFIDGEIFAMSGGTGRHAELSAKIIFLLGRGHCRFFDSALKIYIPSTNQVLYPDASVVCGQVQYFDTREDVLLNPTLVVEVLSPSTQRYDKTVKAAHYRTLPSLQHCLLVAQHLPFIEHTARSPDQTWILQSHTSLENRIALPELNLELTVAEIYRGIL